MDVSGAAALQIRLQQQKQWQQASSVRDGSQPPVDPDVAALRRLGFNERVYAGPSGSFVKRLTGGAWARQGAEEQGRQRVETPNMGALAIRLEQQKHWQRASAVQNGTQPRTDPDADALRELRFNERLYEQSAGAFAKLLVDGAWARVEIG